VKEPFYKIARDKKNMIRVDDPSDIVFEEMEETSLDEFRDSGK
jgi:hypothetical protein